MHTPTVTYPLKIYQEYTVEKEVSSISGVGKAKKLHVKQ